jgi:hypothetical protein
VKVKTKRHRDDIIALSVIAIAVTATIIGNHFSSFRYFFAWPSGGTWSNTIAWLEDDIIALFAFWYFRRSLGPRIAKWWHSHNDEHINARFTDQTSEIHDHIIREIAQLERRVHGLLADQDDRIVTAVDEKMAHHFGNGSADGSAHD